MIYLDHAATTPLRGSALTAMERYFAQAYGNPSSIHQSGRAARLALDAARHTIAEFVDCQTAELLFTSGGTESIHSALFGAWLAQPQKRHVVTTAVEHHAVLHTCQLLEELGLQVTVVPTDRVGRVSVAQLTSAIRPDTLVVSVMRINNEIGTIVDIAGLVQAVKLVAPEVLFHSDMVQALSSERLSLDALGVDMASFSAHKVNGPKGVGALFLRRGTPWKSALRGGAQERDRRAGTENVPGIVGFAAAVSWLEAHWPEHQRTIHDRSVELMRGLQRIVGTEVNSPTDATPGIVNVRFVGVRADRLLMRLDLEGIAASAGSACTAGSLQQSHVLAACGLVDSATRESIRFSLADVTTSAEIAETVATLERIVPLLRRS